MIFITAPITFKNIFMAKSATSKSATSKKAAPKKAASSRTSTARGASSRSSSEESMPSDGGGMEPALMELFVDSIKDIYWAEKQLVKTLPKMQKAATSTELKDAIGNHI